MICEVEVYMADINQNAVGPDVVHWVVLWRDGDKIHTSRIDVGDYADESQAVSRAAEMLGVDPDEIKVAV